MANHPDCKYKQPDSLRSRKRIAHVHHIIDPSEGGDFWDDHNLLSVCADYNIAERNRRQNRRAATALGNTAHPEPVKPSREW